MWVERVFDGSGPVEEVGENLGERRGRHFKPWDRAGFEPRRAVGSHRKLSRILGPLLGEVIPTARLKPGAAAQRALARLWRAEVFALPSVTKPNTPIQDD